MIQMFICEPEKNWQILTELPTNFNGVAYATLALNTEVAHKLSMSVNATLASHYEILRDKQDVGILIREVNEKGDITQTFGFVKDRQPQAEFTSGRLTLGFLSSAYRLTTSYPRNIPNYYTHDGSAAELIAQIAPNFNWQLVGSDANIRFDTGVLSNLEILNEVINQVGGWTWVDAGLDNNNNTIIKFGDFKSLNPKRRARIADLTDPFDKETILINGDPKVNLSGEEITHLKVTGLTGMGAESSSSLQFNLANYSFVSPEYPILDVGERDINGNVVGYIFNTPTSNVVKHPKYKSIEVEVSPNSEDANGIQVINPDLGLEAIYAQGVNYLQARSFAASLSASLVVPGIIIPGEPIAISVNKKLQGWTKSYETAHLKDVIGYIGNIEYDLSSGVATVNANAKLLANPKNRPAPIGADSSHARILDLERKQALKEKTPQAIRVVRPFTAQSGQKWHKPDRFDLDAVFSNDLGNYASVIPLPSKDTLGLDPIRDLTMYVGVSWGQTVGGSLSAADGNFECPVYFNLIRLDYNQVYQGGSNVLEPYFCKLIGSLRYNDLTQKFNFLEFKETFKLADTIEERTSFNSDGGKLTEGQLNDVIRNGETFAIGIFIDDRDLSGANKNVITSARNLFEWKYYVSFNYDGVQATR